MKVAPLPRGRTREPSLIELVARANHLLNEEFCEQAKAQGLSPTEGRVLAALYRHDGITMTELADLLLLKQPTLTKAVDRLERAQHVERRTPDEDRRRTQVHLRSSARRIAAPLALGAVRHAAAVERLFGEAAARELEAALSSLIAVLTRARHPVPAAASDERAAADGAGIAG